MAITVSMDRDESAPTSPSPTPCLSRVLLLSASLFSVPRWGRSDLPTFQFRHSPLPHPRKNRPFLFMHLRGTHFASPLFSNSCMEWGVCTPSPPKKEQLMNTTTVSSIPHPIAVPPNADTSRCPYLYPNGKRCSLPGLPVHSGFCLRHSQPIAPTAIPVPVYNDSEDFSADLLPQLSEFTSGVDINKSLPRLPTP